MITAQKVFEMAIDLLDRRSSSGAISDNETKKYKFKTPNLLTFIQTEILSAEGSTTEPVVIADLSNNLLITDRSAILIAPYGLAAHLALQDGLDTAPYFNQRYEELLRKIPQEPKEIEDVYGGLEENTVGW